MRLTDQQVRETISTMRLTKADKQRLLSQALANNPGARLVVYSRFIGK